MMLILASSALSGIVGIYIGMRITEGIVVEGLKRWGAEGLAERIRKAKTAKL